MASGLGENALVAVVNGKSVKLFKSAGNGGALKPSAMPVDDVSTDNKGSGGRHANSLAKEYDGTPCRARSRSRLTMVAPLAKR